MRHNYFIITVILLVLVQTFSIQNASAQSIKQIGKLMLKYEYAESVALLEKIIQKEGKHSQEAKEKLAMCYRLMNEPELSAKWYAEIIEIEGINPENYFYYGEMLKTLGKYKEAQQQFLKYKSLVPEDNKAASLSAKNCADIIPQLSKPDKFTITNASKLNTKYSEFSPIIYKNELVFTSDRPKEDKRAKTYSWTGNSYLDLYSSEIDFNNEFNATNPKVFNSELSQAYHDGTAVFSKDWKTVFYTRTTSERVKKGDNPVATIVLKMYSSKYIDGHWTEAEPFYLNSNEYSVGHPALSADGKKIYFVSDMPNGFGGTDIYECSLKNGTWTNVKNLGKTINTEGNEMFPYINDDELLYFSSTGHLGYGGLDVFSTKQNNEEWETPENMRAPLNSSYDDFGICFVDEWKGFVSSNRAGGNGKDDIYVFEKLKPLFITGHVISNEGLVLADATVFLHNEKTNKVLILKTDSDGKYHTKIDRHTSYTILSKKHLFFDDCTTLKITNKAINPVDLVLTKFPEKKIIEVEPIYYDLDKYFIRADAEPALDHVVKVMQENPIKIELASHTDCRANHEYNVVLSQNRAEAATNYIVSKGIDPNRITAKGYGETQLINECADGIKCSEEQHQLNRRTVFTIIEEVKKEELIIDFLQQFKAGDIYDMKEIREEYFTVCKK